MEPLVGPYVRTRKTRYNVGETKSIYQKSVWFSYSLVDIASIITADVNEYAVICIRNTVLKTRVHYGRIRKGRPRKMADPVGF